MAASPVDLSGLIIRLITAPYFVATKLEAFHGRGQGDFSASHDLEDLVAVIDGRPEIVNEVHEAEQAVRSYIAEEIQQLLNSRGFVEALPGLLLPDSATQARFPELLRRLRALAAAPR